MNRDINPMQYVFRPETGEPIRIPDEMVEYWKAVGALERIHERKAKPFDREERFLLGSGVGVAAAALMLAGAYLVSRYPVWPGTYAVLLVSLAASCLTDAWRVWRRL